MIRCGMSTAGLVGVYRGARDKCLRTVLVSVGDQDTAQDLVDEAFARACASWRKVAGIGACGVGGPHRAECEYLSVAAPSPPLASTPAPRSSAPRSRSAAPGKADHERERDNQEPRDSRGGSGLTSASRAGRTPAMAARPTALGMAAVSPEWHQELLASACQARISGRGSRARIDGLEDALYAGGWTPGRRIRGWRLCAASAV